MAQNQASKEVVPLQWYQITDILDENVWIINDPDSKPSLTIDTETNLIDFNVSCTGNEPINHVGFYICPTTNSWEHRQSYYALCQWGTQLNQGMRLIQVLTDQNLVDNIRGSELVFKAGQGLSAETPIPFLFNDGNMAPGILYAMQLKIAVPDQVTWSGPLEFGLKCVYGGTR